MRTTANIGPIVLLVPVLYLYGAAARAESADVLKQVGFDQRLNEQVPLDLEFVDDMGTAVRLGDYFGQKPVILVLAYYRCPMLCTLVLNGLTQAMRNLPFTTRQRIQRGDGEF